MINSFSIKYHSPFETEWKYVFKVEAYSIRWKSLFLFGDVVMIKYVHSFILENACSILFSSKFL